MHADTTQRGGFSGMWQIFLYNWHFYAAALVLDVIAVVFLVRFSPPAGIRIAVMLACAIASFFSFVVLAGVPLCLRSLAFVSMELVGASGEAKSGQLGEYPRRTGPDQRSSDSTLPCRPTQNSGHLCSLGNERTID